jgi:aspartate 1-decarboxylase
MLLTTLHSKISYAKITQTELFYEGSITIDEDILDRAKIRPFEQVHVVNLNNGERLVTYTIAGPRGSNVFCLNGPAARNSAVGDLVHILSYAHIDSKAETVNPTIVDLKS